MARIFRLCITCCFVFALACGGGNNDSSNGGTNNNTNSGTNNTNSSNNTNNSDTNNGETNNNITTTNNETNNNNTNGMMQCDAAGDDCTEGEPTNMGFICVDSTCRQGCDLNAMQEDCRSGAVCLPVAQGGPGYCQPSDCDGLLDDSCPAGEQCIAARNDANICIPVGNIGEGDACEATDMDPFPCAPGLFCVFGVCETMCADDAACDAGAGKSCVNDTLDDGVGFCGVGCDSYSEGQCPDGQGCFPITAEEGVCDDVGTIGYYQECDPTAMTAQCQENSSCLTFQGADDAAGIPAVARCLPFCNAGAPSQGAANDTCPAPAGDGGSGRFVHLAEGAGPVDVYVDDTLEVDDLAFEAVSAGGSFLTLSTGQHTVDIVAGADADNSSPILTVTPTIAAGDAFTWGIVPDPTATVQVVTVDVPAGEASPAAGNAKLRAVHGIPDFGNVDVVAIPDGDTDFANEVELALDLAFGDAGGFAEVAADTYDIYLFGAGDARTIDNMNGVTVQDVVVAGDVTFSAWARGTADDGDGADTGLTTVSYVSASSGGSLSGFCFDLGDGTAQSGFCFEQCPDSDTYGTNSCSGPSDVCSPANQGGSLCFPGGPNTADDACNPDNSVEGCDGVSWCQARGDGSGICEGFCQPDTQSNTNLGCSGDEVCAEVDTNLGRCRVECTPDDSFADSSCPANLQTCHPPDLGEPSYCAASGDLAVGDTCEIFGGQCAPGDSCINDYAAKLDAETNEDVVEDGVCAASCDPFGDGSECGGNQVCAINWLTFSRAVGHCITPDEDLNKDDPCQAELNICGERSICLDVGMGPQCIQTCDLDDASTCSGSCMQIFQSAALRIGACI